MINLIIGIFSIGILTIKVNALQCGHKVNASAWTQDEELRTFFVEDSDVKPFVPPTVVVDLDLDPSERWLEVGKQYANQSYLVKQYFESLLPKWALDIIVPLAKDVVNYKGFGDFSDEMRGYSEGLGLELGYVVAANLVYQLEHIGVNCSNWNATGPTDSCKKKKKKGDIAWLESEWNAKRELTDPIHSGMCTSVVANNKEGQIIHGRNLDWNLPEEVKQLLITAEFHRGGRLLYKGTTIVSYVGLLNAMRPFDDETGTGGYTFSMDARCQGGLLFYNLLEALVEGAMTPCQHSRTVMETANNFQEAVQGFETGNVPFLPSILMLLLFIFFHNKITLSFSGNLVNDGYFIVGGMKSSEGAVVSRDRNRNADTWYIDQNDEHDDWYVLETNYDHWEVVPSADDRRTPGNSNMMALGSDRITPENLYSNVMAVWPTFNPHTDVTCIMSAAQELFNCTAWLSN